MSFRNIRNIQHNHQTILISQYNHIPLIEQSYFIFEPYHLQYRISPMIKETRKKDKLTKTKSNHRLLMDSAPKIKDKSILSNDPKKNKNKQKSIHAANTPARSAPKIRIKIPKNITNCEEQDDSDTATDEYFIFENRIFPIINSDEKRTVNRFFWTSDISCKENRMLKDNSTTCTGFSIKPEMKQNATMTNQIQKIQTKDYGLQIKLVSETKNQDTMTSAPPAPKTVKSFQEVLNELEFLYLPNSKNFEDLSNLQKQHYRQLFLALANKFVVQSKLESPRQMDANQPLLSPRNLSEFVAFQVQKRISQQVNCVDIQIERGIPTNLLCILSYLSNLFCFIEVQYREQLLRGLNTPYGYYNQQRFSLVKRGKSLRRAEKILPDSIYSELQSEFFAEDETLDEATVQFMHIHNRAIFDHLNDELNLFRPFFSCNGQPYPWFIPGKITFFSISEEDIELVLEKAKVKILESASLLCGIHCDAQPPFTKSTIDQSVVLKDVRQERQRKFIFAEIMDIDESVEIQDQRTKLLVQIAESIYQQLIQDANHQIGELARGDSFYIPVFDL